MPELDGILVTMRITKEFPDIKVIIFSMHRDRQYAVDAFKAGARGYILKGGDSSEILLAVKQVLSGQIYVSPPLADEILSDFVNILKGDQETLDPFDSLTLREREVLKLIAEGNTNKKVAEKLFLAESTIKSYRANIMMKLKVHDTAGLVKLAVHKGLINFE
jgi:two-component system response regulator NreC